MSVFVYTILNIDSSSLLPVKAVVREYYNLELHLGRTGQTYWLELDSRDPAKRRDVVEWWI